MAAAAIAAAAETALRARRHVQRAARCRYCPPPSLTTERTAVNQRAANDPARCINVVSTAVVVCMVTTVIEHAPVMFVLSWSFRLCVDVFRSLWSIAGDFLKFFFNLAFFSVSPPPSGCSLSSIPGPSESRRSQTPKNKPASSSSSSPRRPYACAIPAIEQSTRCLCAHTRPANTAGVFDVAARVRPTVQPDMVTHRESAGKDRLQLSGQQSHASSPPPQQQSLYQNAAEDLQQPERVAGMPNREVKNAVVGGGGGGKEVQLTRASSPMLGGGPGGKRSRGVTTVLQHATRRHSTLYIYRFQTVFRFNEMTLNLWPCVI